MAMPIPSSRVRVPTTTSPSSLNLPAGFRFHPTDEELIVHYLTKQAAGHPCPVPIIAEVNIYQCNPWELPAKAVSFGESGEWYFFSPRDRKYPNGARPNRAAGTGYWKATGTDKAILSTHTGHCVGVKKALVFYGGRPPRGVKTDWIMHEYRLTATADGKTTAAKRRGGGGGGSMRLDDWVLCRIHKKSNDFFQSQRSSSSSSSDHHEHEQEGSSTVDDEDSPKPEPLVEHDQFHHQTMTMSMSKSCSLTDLLNSIDCSALSQMLDDDDDDGPLLADAGAGGELTILPQQNPPIIYPTTTTQTHQPINYNYNNKNHLKSSSMPHTTAAACCSGSADYVVVANNNNCNNNGVNKRKRMTTMVAGMAMDDAYANESLDGGGNSGFSRNKLKKTLPSDYSTNIVIAAGSTPSSSYCNQQQVVDTSGLLFQSYINSSLLMSYPFLEMQ